MTNILAAVMMCLVTNVTEADNSYPIQWMNIYEDCDGGILPGTQPAYLQGNSIILDGGWYGSPGPISGPTEKTITTVVERVHTIKFKWRGKEMRGEDREEVSRTVRTYKKREEWEEVE